MREIEYKFVDNPEQPIGAGKVFCVTNSSGEYLTVINDIPSLSAPKNVSVDLEYMVSLLRMVIRHRRFGITREVITEEERHDVDPAAVAEAKHDETVEEINSIDYLLRQRDEDSDQQESQFGDDMMSSFDDSSDDSGS